MTLLVISPDYASHAMPLIAIAGAWRERGHRVVVASGEAVAPLVRRARMEHVELVMSRGSNAGNGGASAKVEAEARSLDGFFAATRLGMLATLEYQAQARSVDLLWRPEWVARRTIALVEEIRPDEVMVDHLAFGAAIGLRGMGRPYVDVVLGHPTALPVGGEVYGVPTAWPAAFKVDVVSLESLHRSARAVAGAFTEAYDRALRSIDPRAASVADAFRAHGDLVLYNYPAVLHDERRTPHLPAHAFLGSSVRREKAPPDVAAWLERPDPRPIVVVSFGTFLSARSDVLARVAAALAHVDARVALAVGGNDPRSLGTLPSDWLVRPTLPQVALLQHADLLVTHGGNNSITEALTFGVPMVLMPFSTDQFDGAAAVEAGLAGISLDPNRTSRRLISDTVRGLLRSRPRAALDIGQQLHRERGPDVAFGAVTGTSHRRVRAHLPPESLAS